MIRLATYSERVGAFAIDALIVVTPFWILANWAVAHVDGLYFSGNVTQFTWWKESSAVTLLVLRGLVDGWILATPGRRLAKIKVVDRSTGLKLGAGRGLFRSLMFGATLPLAIAWSSLGQQRRGLHDVLAGSIVVQISWTDLDLDR